MELAILKHRIKRVVTALESPMCSILKFIVVFHHLRHDKAIEGPFVWELLFTSDHLLQALIERLQLELKLDNYRRD